MKNLRAFLCRLSALFRRRTLESEMNEELRGHLDALTERNLAAGMPLAEARYAALRAFGGVAQIAERAREERRSVWVEHVLKDLRFGARQLGRNRTFTATAVLTLALCIGANLAIFAVIDAVLLRPLPFSDAERLVTVFNSYPKAGINRYDTFLTSYYERRGNLPAFSSLSIYRDSTAIIGETGSTHREAVLRVSADFFATLGTAPIAGRAFTEAEMARETDKVVIVTDAYWRQQLGAVPDVVGRPIRINGVTRHIVGLLPPGFRFLSSKAQVYLPLSSGAGDREPHQRHGGTEVTMIARFAPGASLAQAQAQLDAHNTAMERDNPRAKMVADAGFRSLVAPLHADHVAGIRPTLVLLQGGAFLLLLIGAVNVGNLLLIRAGARAKELAIRQSLGASGRHVVIQVMTETTLLTLLGGFAGIAVGAWGVEFVRLLGADQLPLGAEIAFDRRLAGMALSAAAVLGVALSIPIAAHNLRVHLAYALQSQSRGGTTARAAQRVRHGFIVAQIALAFVLLAGAGLLALSLRRTLAVSPGFRPEQVLTAQLSLPPKNYGKTALLVSFTEQLLAEVAGQPGVAGAGVITSLPFGSVSPKGAVTIHGRVRPPGESLRAHYVCGVTGDYFGAMNIPLVAGRRLTADDSRRPERVCVVDADFASHYWPAGDALGRRIVLGSDEKPENETFSIVGIVAPVKHAGLTENAGQGAVYFPYQNLDDSDFYVVVRTERSPESFGSVLRALVRQIDADLPLNDLRPMEQRVAGSVATRRSSALLVALFSVVAILLTAVGTYGVLSFAVLQRMREIGVRIALGARPDQIRGEFLSQGGRLLIAGLALGLPGAWMAGRAMQGILFEVPPLPLVIVAGVTMVMSAVSLAACLIPARRAAKVDPMVALRAE